MRRLVLAVLIVLALAQGYGAVQWSRHEYWYASARQASEAGEAAKALDLMERAVSVRPGAEASRVWVGDLAQELLDNVEDGATPERRRAILDRGWGGYAAAIALSPLDAASWSGLAEIAVRRSQLADAVAGVPLDVVAERGHGVVDPWRAAALGAAELAVSISPAGYQQLDTLAGVYESAGQVERAADTYVRSARLMAAPLFHSWGTGRVFAKPIYARLIAGLEEGVAGAPEFDRSLLHVEIARFAREQGDIPTCVAHARLAEKAARNPFQRHRAAVELAFGLERDDPDGALEAWHRSEQPGMDAALVASSEAALELRRGDARDACAHYRAALREESGALTVRLAASAACEKAGDVDSAEQLLSSGFVDPVEAMPVAEALVDFLERTGRLLTARTLVNQWLRDHPDRPEFRNWAERLNAPDAAPEEPAPGDTK
jgi:tetratricopeptide (TPR) repeat protein